MGHVTVETLKKLDGGGLEDALVALGEFGEHDMEPLLSFANKGVLHENGLRSAVTMITLLLSDNPRAYVNVLRTRKRLIANIKSTHLYKEQEIALYAIDKVISEIMSLGIDEASCGISSPNICAIEKSTQHE